MCPAVKNMETCGVKYCKKGEYFGQNWMLMFDVQLQTMIYMLWSESICENGHTIALYQQNTSSSLYSLNGHCTIGCDGCDIILLCQVHSSSHTWTLRICDHLDKYFYTNICWNIENQMISLDAEWEKRKW